jgi:hypothetical protein
MKPIFLNTDELKYRTSSHFLLIFKYGVLCTVIIQTLGFLFDYDLIFSFSGHFPHSVSRIYLTNPIFMHFDSYAKYMLLIMIFLAISAFAYRLQTFFFVCLFVCEWLLTRGAFFFTNAGDTALLFLTLMGALTPPVSFAKRPHISIVQILPIYALTTIIYIINFFLKLTSDWGRGKGLYDSLSHHEISWPFTFNLAENPVVSFLNYFAIFIVFLMALTPVISLTRKRLRNSLVAIGIIYHLAANLLFHLSWLSLPFIFLQIALFSPRKIFPKLNTISILKYWKPQIAGIFLISAFFGLRAGSEIIVLKDFIFPIGHNWYMFAPPPTSTLQWELKIDTKKESIIWSQAELSSRFHFFIFQHQYKFFYNMRRAEALPLADRFENLLCQQAANEIPDIVAVQLRLYLRSFDTDEPRIIEYPIKPCY